MAAYGAAARCRVAALAAVVAAAATRVAHAAVLPRAASSNSSRATATAAAAAAAKAESATRTLRSGALAYSAPSNSSSSSSSSRPPPRVEAAAVSLEAPPPPPAPLPTRFSALVQVAPDDAGPLLGRRVDDVLRSCVVDTETGEAPPLALVNAWVRREVCRVVSAAGTRAAPPAATLSYRLQHGDAVIVHDSIGERLRRADVAVATARTSPTGTPPRWLASAVRWCGDDVAVISKPPGVATQGGTGIAPRDVVDTWLPTLARCHLPRPRLPSHTGDATLRLVHRLDRDVGGLLLLARNRGAADACRIALAGREGAIRKTYVAIVAGPPLPPGVPRTGVIDVPTRAGDQDAAGGGEGADTPALSRYAVFTPTAAGAGPPPLERFTVLLMEPVTGRKHQLRQHVVALWRGAAGIAGDRKYGGGGARVRGSALLLHAAHLQLAPGLAGTRAPVDVFDALPPPFAPHVADDARLRGAILAFAAQRRHSL